MKTRKKYSSLNQSIARALDILEVFSPDKMEWTPTEMSVQVGLNVSTAHRMMQTLEYRGMLEQNPENGRYRIGIKAYRIGSNYITNNMLERYAPALLDGLAERIGHEVHMGYLDTRTAETVVIYSRQGRNLMQASSQQPGVRMPAQVTAVGKAIMAFLEADNPDKFNTVMNMIAFNPYTTRSAVSSHGLRAECAEIRKRGYAMDDREGHESVRGVAAPIFNHLRNVVGAVGASGYAEALALEKLPELAQAVLATAEAISSKMGNNA